MRVCVCVCFLSMIKLVVVLRVPYGVGSRVYVPLTCGEAYQDQPVFWKKNGKIAVTSTFTDGDTFCTATCTSNGNCANEMQ